MMSHLPEHVPETQITEMFKFADATFKRTIGDQGFGENEDPFLFFHKIVKKDALDAATFD